jgi:rhodanese-related sulfurtransferase
VFVADSKNELLSLRVASVLLRVLFVLAAFLIVSRLYRLVVTRSWSPALRAICLVLVAVPLAVVGDMAIFFGPTASRVAASNSAGAASNAQYAEVKLADMQQFDLSSINLVDARFANDFAKGTIHSAVNFPVDSDSVKGRAILNALDRSKETVIFCQSSACLYSDKIARRFEGAGFQNIKIFRAGYVAWKNALL